MGVTANIAPLADALSKASGISMQQAASEIVRNSAYAIQRKAQELAPIKTGVLSSSITVTFHGPLTAVVAPEAFYGVFQEFGTGTRGEFPGQPYVIRPKKPGGYLVFEIDGKKIFTREVHHPGIPPHPFMRPAAQDVLDDLANQLADAGVSQVMQ